MRLELLVIKMAEKSDPPGSSATAAGQDSQQLLSTFLREIMASPVNLVLVGVIALLVYKIVKGRTKPNAPQPVKTLPKLRRDFTNKELLKYNGRGPDGRILLAVNGSVYDVTKGAMFYGPGGPYESLAGYDASRSLATFNLKAQSEEYDDLSDLDITEMNSVKEWQEQIEEKYDYVGKLLKPGEAPTNYSDEEDEESQQETESKMDKAGTETKSDHQTTESKSKDD